VPTGGHYPGHPDLWKKEAYHHILVREGSEGSQSVRPSQRGGTPSGPPGLTLKLSSSTPNLQGGGATPSGRVATLPSPVAVPRALERSSSLTLAAAGQRPKQRLMSAAGSGGFHFWSDPDDDFGVAQHEASEARKWENRQQLNTKNRERCKQAFNPTYGSQANANGRAVYDVNGKVFENGKRTVPAPEQVNRAHWLCQVNSMTGDYNIINNTFLDPAITKCRQDQIGTLRKMKEADKMAGDTQPTRPVACYEMRSFVPWKERSYQGVAERHGSLFS